MLEALQRVRQAVGDDVFVVGCLDQLPFSLGCALMDINRMMAEFRGKEAGYCKGKGGCMHIADFSKGSLGATGIVGGGIRLAVGAALS